MMCDITIAADNALFGEPEIRFSNVGPAMIMPFIIGFTRAHAIFYLGEPIAAPTALSYGMVNRVVPRAHLQEATMKFARLMALMAPESLRVTKLAGFRNAIRAGLDVPAPLYPATTEVGKKFRRAPREGRSRRRAALACRAVHGVAGRRPSVDQSMTRSARNRSSGGIVSPSAFAVCMLITNTNVVGCSTGRSAGLAPLRILST